MSAQSEPQKGCWHDRKTRSVQSLGSGRILSETIRCEDCGLVRVYLPCPTCGHLADLGTKESK